MSGEKPSKEEGMDGAGGVGERKLGKGSRGNIGGEQITQQAEKRKCSYPDKGKQLKKVKIGTASHPISSKKTMIEDEPVAGPSGYQPQSTDEVRVGAYSSDEEEEGLMVDEQVANDDAAAMALYQEELDQYSPFPGFFNARDC